MNILVLNPPFKTQFGKFSTQSRSPSISKGGTVYYPYFLAYATGVLEEEGFDVDFIDACADRIERESIPLLVRNSPELVIIGTTTPSIYEDIKTLEFLKKYYHNAFFLLVGHHVSFLTEETFKLSSCIDGIARKEFEYTVRDLARIMKWKGTSGFEEKLKEIDGLSFRRKDKKIIHNNDRELIENLDDLPFVSKVYEKHLSLNNYFFAASDYPLVQILSGRGCLWGKCTFCTTPSFEGAFYRQRSVENFVDELEWIKKNLPEIREIGIEDGCFGPNERIRKICQEIINRRLNIKWYCNVRVTLDINTMFYMKQAGCHLLTVGFESSSIYVLKNIKKGITPNQMKQFVDNANEVGLLVHGCFMAGNPGDTKEILLNNLNFAKELKCDTMQFFPLMVYPGTESFSWANREGIIKETRWDKWVTNDGQYNTVISLPSLSNEELVKISNDSVKQYHLRPSFVIYKFKRVISHPDEIVRTYKGFMSFIKNVLKG